MPNIKVILEYHGAGFSGWQQQPGVRSIDDEFRRALTLVMRAAPERVAVAGRTDAGVHARGQVVNFFVADDVAARIDLRRLSRSVSSILRSEVSVVSAEFVPGDFNARFSAREKQYSYTILHRETLPALDYGFCWHISGRLEIDAMRAAAHALEGEHDFTSFRGSRCMAASPVRRIYSSELIEKPPYLIYRVRGAGFLKQMVRNIVGTLVGMGRGTMRGLSMEQVLAARNRRIAGVTAPPYGLCLDWVRYDQTHSHVPPHLDEED